MAGAVWHTTGTYIRELRRLGFSLSEDRRSRLMQRPPKGLTYLQSPSRKAKSWGEGTNEDAENQENQENQESEGSKSKESGINKGIRQSSYRPQPDLQDIGSKLKYFLVLDGIDDDEIECGARPMLAKCAFLNSNYNQDNASPKCRIVAFWVVSRVMLVTASKRSEPPDLHRCPRPGQTLRFKQPRRSACMAETPTSPLYGLDLSQGEVIDICPGAPGAVACAFVRFYNCTMA